MMQGLEVLWGPTVFPTIGPVSVSVIGTAEAVPASANIATVVPTASHVSRPFMSRSSIGCITMPPYGASGVPRKQRVSFGQGAR
jgi:hypothetical protein